MKKRFTLLFAMLAALVTTAMADNVISVEQTAISQSGTAELIVNLANTGVVRGLEFTLTLPDGVTAVGSNESITYGNGEDDKYAPENGVLVSKTDRTTGWWVLGNKVSDYVYKFIMLDPNGDGMEAGTGAIMKISFTTNLPSFDANITGIHMSTESSTADVTQTDIENVNVTVSDVQKGDANGNGIIEVDDAVCIMRHKVGKSNDTFIETAADVNGNGIIEVDDAVQIMLYKVGKIDALSRGPKTDTDMDAYDPD